MLLRNFHLLPGEPLTFLALVGFGMIALVVAITIHEFSHTLVANGLGDSTAKNQGRLSLNPIRHLDPVGTVMILMAGFGWGKPVPVDQHRLALGPKGMTLVAAAGPLSNLSCSLFSSSALISSIANSVAQALPHNQPKFSPATSA